MYDVLTLSRIPISIVAGIFAGWLGARNELRLAGGNRDKARGAGSGLMLRMRALRYSLSFYLILATLSFSAGEVYASRHGLTVLPASGVGALMPTSLQTLTTGAMTACFATLYFIQSLSDKHGLDLW